MKLTHEVFNMIPVIPVRCLFMPRTERKIRSQRDKKVCKGPKIPMKDFLTAWDTRMLRDIPQ